MAKKTSTNVINMIKSYRDLKHYCDANSNSFIARYLRRIGARPRSLLSAVVEEKSGTYWKDTGRIKFFREGDVQASNKNLEPDEDEKNGIKDELIRAKFPDEAGPVEAAPIPKQIKEWNITPENIFKFLNERGEILMYQLRTNETDKELRKYISLTLYDDGEWHVAEPEGGLPIYGIENIKDASTVFLHEGAKAARRMHEMVNFRSFGEKMREKYSKHPWSEWLSTGVHCGWIGGALASERTDFRIFKRLGVKTLIIVADNDDVGKSAIRVISKASGMETFAIQFNGEFPSGFDLADDFPDSMFKDVNGYRLYDGPDYLSCLTNVTWATRLVKNEEDKWVPELQDHFRNMWIYVPAVDMYVCKSSPWLRYPPAVFNRLMSAYSDTRTLSWLVAIDRITHVDNLAYEPYDDGDSMSIVHVNHRPNLNTYVPSPIIPREGESKPFLDFMSWLIPDEKERDEVERWVATLIAKPSLKMRFSLMLVSETQGVGKTTLCSAILAPLVGWHNVSQPSEEIIVGSPFNDWLAGKRLAIVAELYAGKSWKAYHKLKESISDSTVTVNEKYVKSYNISNWIHAVVCSNSYRAMNMDHYDRRWLVPKLREEKWPNKKSQEFYQWLKLGGLSIIKQWALDYPNYVRDGEEAPMTDNKKVMVEESRSEAQREAISLVEAMDGEIVACTMSDIKFWLRDRCQGKVFDSDSELRRTMRDAGALWTSERIRVGGQVPQFVCISREGFKALKEEGLVAPERVGVEPLNRIGNAGRGGSPFNNKIKEMLKKPGEITTPEM